MKNEEKNKGNKKRRAGRLKTRKTKKCFLLDCQKKKKKPSGNCLKK